MRPTQGVSAPTESEEALARPEQTLPTTPIVDTPQPPLCDISTLNGFILFLSTFMEDRNDPPKILSNVIEVTFIKNWYSNAEMCASKVTWDEFKTWFNEFNETKLPDELPPAWQAVAQIGTAVDQPASSMEIPNLHIKDVQKVEEDKSEEQSAEPPTQSRWARLLRRTPVDCFMHHMP
ncbi:hypothetical protein BDQ17DRAFT_1350804 [Cyathus striatus]|nr:hypothetical protein BDQ17DRAFT_1350804 [Cyathus striatus]